MLSTFYPKNDGEKWSRKNYFEITPCGKMIISITEFVILRKNHPFYELRKNEFPGSRFPHGETSKKISRPLFTIISRPKFLFFDTDSILMVKTMVVNSVLITF
jgi:hypothetical protein